MSLRLVNIDRGTPMIFPVDMRDWLPENHLVHFVIDAVNQLDISRFKVNNRGSGDEQYPPEMMLALLIYSYVTGRFWFTNDRSSNVYRCSVEIYLRGQSAS